MKIKYLPGAQDDYQGAVDYYDLVDFEIGDLFILEVEGAERRLLEFPEIGSSVDHIHRKLFFDKFPYSLIYRIEPDVVLIIAIAHSKRKPDFWQNRA